MKSSTPGRPPWPSDLKNLAKGQKARPWRSQNIVATKRAHATRAYIEVRRAAGDAPRPLVELDGEDFDPPPRCAREREQRRDVLTLALHTARSAAERQRILDELRQLREGA
jgi:hypothetical protein